MSYITYTICCIFVSNTFADFEFAPEVRLVGDDARIWVYLPQSST